MTTPSNLSDSVIFCPRSDKFRLITGLDDFGVPVTRDLTEEELLQYLNQSKDIHTKGGEKDE